MPRVRGTGHPARARRVRPGPGGGDHDQRGGHPGARLFCSRLAAQTRAESSRGYARWLEQCESHHTASEQLQLYGQLVLSEADRRARACVMRWSGEAAVLVAISPLAMVDMLLILWRSVRMIDEVALPEGCYISALVRQGSVLMAHHDVIIESGDHLIVFVSRRRQIHEIEKLFEVRLGFF